jgi:hypothetical protein
MQHPPAKGGTFLELDCKEISDSSYQLRSASLALALGWVDLLDETVTGVGKDTSNECSAYKSRCTTTCSSVALDPLHSLG